MAKLIPPDGKTIVVTYGEFWTWTKKWHIARKGSTMTGMCGRVCIQPQYKTLEEIPPDELCEECWPYEKELL